MAQSEVETFNQTGADRVAQRFEPLAPAAHAVEQLLETPLAFLFDHLAIDQIRVGFPERLLGASWLSRAWKGLQGMVDVNGTDIAQQDSTRTPDSTWYFDWGFQTISEAERA